MENDNSRSFENMIQTGDKASNMQMERSTAIKLIQENGSKRMKRQWARKSIAKVVKSVQCS